MFVVTRSSRGVSDPSRLVLTRGIVPIFTRGVVRLYDLRNCESKFGVVALLDGVTRRNNDFPAAESSPGVAPRF